MVGAIPAERSTPFAHQTGIIMRKMLIDLLGIATAAVVFWLAGVLLIPLVVLAWPINGSTADLPLKPQNLPSMIVGFVFALYTFRRLTGPTTRHTSQVITALGQR